MTTDAPTRDPATQEPYLFITRTTPTAGSEQSFLRNVRVDRVFRKPR